MLSARLYGPRDMRVERVPRPTDPGPDETLLQVTVTSICGSDLHWYTDGGIGETRIESPLVVGHEFAGVVAEIGENARDGFDNPLSVGQRVAVDPAMPCHRCEYCEKGHPNLCRRLHFCGTFPDDGSLSEFMIVPARTCFPLPDELTNLEGAMMEPLGIGIHAVRLAEINIAESVAVLGSGPIGLFIIALAKLAGASPIIATDLHPWRLEMAKLYGADLVFDGNEDPVQSIRAATGDRGVDVVFEAAFGNETVYQSAQVAGLGARVVLIGITEKNSFALPASTSRRKGLTIKMSRRMKHTYPTAMKLALERKIDLNTMVTHRFPLADADRAFALNAAYENNMVKAVIESALVS
ncbi:MAG: alcohol dehydrogenase [Armatimonadetes bacterium CG2_30_59_28]|nr:alcohol dehydrogenase catalytic domain-containing protein [Armatimonadota bacterium]OIO93765.1 MAG: alcohol dehydrogenase [Armatimonadetes bacterium CG2_30_59_28]PIU67488.1 MAG: alcohol dehydrogenase [Armatimonadetes bacterium CG07_land_8_20_14_0_80_59_28]